jgi:hypothetical protein
MTWRARRTSEDTGRRVPARSGVYGVGDHGGAVMAVVCDGCGRTAGAVRFGMAAAEWHAGVLWATVRLGKPPARGKGGMIEWPADDWFDARGYEFECPPCGRSRSMSHEELVARVEWARRAGTLRIVLGDAWLAR